MGKRLQDERPTGGRGESTATNEAYCRAPTIDEPGELPSAGDPASPGVADVDADHVDAIWYSSNLAQDEPWSRAASGGAVGAGVVTLDPAERARLEQAAFAEWYAV